MDRLAPRTLIATGLVLLALRSLLQTMFDRAGHGTDLSDFLFGVMFGIGIALTIVGIWRGGRGGRNRRSACAQ